MRKVKIYTLSDPRKPDVVRYVGKTTSSLKKRLIGHIAATNNQDYKYHNVQWIRSLLKAGVHPIIQLIDSVPHSEWGFWERHYISLYRSWGFDLTNTTEGEDDISAEFLEAGKATRFKSGHVTWNKGKNGLSIGWPKGVPKPKELIENLRQINIGHTPWNKGKVGVMPTAWNKGKKWSQEVIETIKRGNVNKRKKVAQYLNDQLVKIWDSPTHAAFELGINKANLCKSASGAVSYKAGGFYWKYINNTPQ